MEVKISPRSAKWPPGVVAEAAFCENGRPSRNTAISDPNAHPALPESSLFVPFGRTSRPKALPKRRQKHVSKKGSTKSSKVLQRWSKEELKFGVFLRFLGVPAQSGLTWLPQWILSSKMKFQGPFFR